MDRNIDRITASKWGIPAILTCVLYLKSLILLFSLYEFSARVFLLSFLGIAPILLIVSFSFLFEDRRKWMFFFVVDLVLSIILYSDLAYFRGLNRLFSVYVLFIKNLTFDLGASAGEFTFQMDFVMLIDLPLIVYILRRNKKLAKNQGYVMKKEPFTRRRLLFGTSFTLSFVLMMTQIFAMYRTEGMENYANHALLLSPVGNHLVNMASFVAEKTTTLRDVDLGNIDSWYDKNLTNLNADPSSEDLFGILEGKNIIVIHFESLESFVLNESFYGKEITPNLNRILNSSISFTGIHEQVREGTSSDTELMFNTGLYPTMKGSAFMSYGNNEYFALPKLLKTKGYETMSLHGDDAKFWNRDVVYPNMGIDKYVDEQLFEDKRYSGLGILDESLFEQSEKELDKATSPFYSYITTVTSHMPFSLEKEYRTLDIPGDNPDMRYLETIHYTDAYLGEFYDSLEEKGLLENSAFIIFGDHEGLHKYYESELPDNDKKLPFIISVPGMEGIEIDTTGGQVDMLPTLLYLMGVKKDVYSRKVMGRNLLRTGPGSVILPSGEILGEPRNEEHLKRATEISNLILAGDYFGEGHSNKVNHEPERTDESPE